MTERLTLAQLNSLRLGVKNKKTQNPQAERRRDFALSALISKLERQNGLQAQGRWPKSREPRTLDLLPNGIVTEYPFCKERGRRYRFDMAIPLKKIALEINGGAYVTRADGSMGGAHHSVEGRARDMAKGNLAAVMGWIVIEVSPKEVADGTAYQWLTEALLYRSGEVGGGGYNGSVVSHDEEREGACDLPLAIDDDSDLVSD